MDDSIQYWANLVLASGVWLAVVGVVGTVSTLFTCFLGIVIARAGFWLWGRLPLWEAQNYRQTRLEREAWKDDEQETRFVRYTIRQRHKWSNLLNGILAELVVLTVYSGLVVLGQPSAWLVLLLGSVLAGLYVLIAWI